MSLLAVPFLGQKLRRRDGVAIVLGYFGALVDDTSLVTGEGARIGRIRFADWLATPAAQR